MPPPHPLSVAQELELHVTGVGADGEGIAHGLKRAVFVPGALPNERVRARINSLGKRVTAELLAVLEPSADRVAPPCPVYGRCGGCQLQHASYGAQLQLKARIVADTLASIAHQGRRAPATGAPVLPVITPSPVAWAYRTRGQFQVGLRGGASATEALVQTGFFSSGSHRLCPVDTCAIHHPLINSAVEQVRRWAASLPEVASVLTQVVLRCSSDGTRLHVTLVTSHDVQIPASDLIEWLAPQLVGLFVRNGAARSASRSLWGSPVLEDHLLGLHLQLSPDAFSQVNPAVATQLFDAARARLRGVAGPVIDLYCGGGVTTLLLAAAGHEAYGIELSTAAISDARRAAAHNQLPATFIAGRAEVELPRLLAKGVRPGAVLLDPPRQGAGPEVLRAIIQARPERLLYISCHPGTLSRDIARLQSGGYALADLQAFDMFPQTSQVECLALLSRT